MSDAKKILKLIYGVEDGTPLDDLVGDIAQAIADGRRSEQKVVGAPFDNEEDAAVAADNGRNTGGKSYR